MRRWTVPAVLLLAPASAAAGADDHGGKIQWGHDHDRAFAEARETGRPLMMFFTADWCGPCRALKAGAFSDEAVVKASEALVRLLLDADRDGKYFQRYEVQGIPTVIFFNPDGKEVDRLKSRAPEEVAAQMKEVAAQHGRNPRFHREYGPARDKAKEEGKPLAIFFHDAKPASQAYARALDHASLAEFYEKMVFVKVEVKKGSPEAKQYNVTDPPILYIVDPAAEKPEQKPYRKIYGPKTAKDFKKDFEEALNRAASR